MRSHGQRVALCGLSGICVSHVLGNIYKDIQKPSLYKMYIFKEPWKGNNFYFVKLTLRYTSLGVT